MFKHRKIKKSAVSLEYGKNETPLVTAKGRDEIAEMIIEEARKHGIQIAKDPKLVAMLSRLEIDDEIPEELYTAVSVVLAWIYWLRGMVPGDEKKKDT